MVEVIFTWAVIYYFHWAGTKPLHNKLQSSRNLPADEAQTEYIANQLRRFSAAAGLAAAGAAIGSFLGIAGFGTAIAGTIPCAVVGWIIGWLSKGGLG